MFYFGPGAYILIPAMIFTMIAQGMVSSAFGKYSRIRNSRNISGVEAARRVLDRNGLQHVQIRQINGHLTDHYDPRHRMLSLSPEVYGGNSISAISVACHEAGHALQHAEGYIPLKLRNGIVPVVNFATKLTWPLMLIGVLLLFAGNGEYGYIGNLALDIAIIAFLAIVVFHLVTLPVEFNASRRALDQMEELSIVASEDIAGSKKVLRAAAMTYVAALALAVANLLRVLAIRGRN
ncbi:Zn-dependent membrane protease YugP [Clostridiales Family XIII bacterium PM5-7]